MIQVDDLTKYFGPVLAVSHVSFRVAQGEIVGFLGPNGAGKTTTMRILTTYLPATSGIARVAGYDVMNQSLDVRRNIGYLPESVPLYPEMRVDEYLNYRAKLKGVERKTRVQQALEKVGMAHRSKHLPSQLSGGQQQRVAVARALVGEPSVLLADEPTGNLDSKNGEAVMELLRELHRAGSTIVMVTHDPRFARYAGRHVNLFDGRVVDESEAAADSRPSAAS